MQQAVISIIMNPDITLPPPFLTHTITIVDHQHQANFKQHRHQKVPKGADWEIVQRIWSVKLKVKGATIIIIIIITIYQQDYHGHPFHHNHHQRCHHHIWSNVLFATEAGVQI